MRHRFWARAGASAAALAGLIGFTACSSDGGTVEEGITVPPKTGGSIFDDLGIEDPERTETRFDQVSSPYEDVAGCKAFGSRFPEVHDCTCEHCFDVQQQCDALDGCIEIAECGIEINCFDANSCYLLATNQKCVPIIDKWGNTGTSAALSLALSGCSQQNKCR